MPPMQHLKPQSLGGGRIICGFPAKTMTQALFFPKGSILCAISISFGMVGASFPGKSPRGGNMLFNSRVMVPRSWLLGCLCPGAQPWLSSQGWPHKPRNTGPTQASGAGFWVAGCGPKWPLSCVYNQHGQSWEQGSSCLCGRGAAGWLPSLHGRDLACSPWPCPQSALLPPSPLSLGTCPPPWSPAARCDAQASSDWSLPHCRLQWP